MSYFVYKKCIYLVDKVFCLQFMYTNYFAYKKDPDSVDK